MRTALSLSVLEAEPFHLTQIRVGRNPQGLRPQHRTAVEAAAAIGNATVTGATVGSTSLTFTPETVRPGTFHFEVGTAGSAVWCCKPFCRPCLQPLGPLG